MMKSTLIKGRETSVKTRNEKQLISFVFIFVFDLQLFLHFKFMSGGGGWGSAAAEVLEL